MQRLKTQGSRLTRAEVPLHSILEEDCELGVRSFNTSSSTERTHTPTDRSSSSIDGDVVQTENTKVLYKPHDYHTRTQLLGKEVKSSSAGQTGHACHQPHLETAQQRHLKIKKYEEDRKLLPRLPQESVFPTKERSLDHKILTPKIAMHMPRLLRNFASPVKTRENSSQKRSEAFEKILLKAPLLSSPKVYETGVEGSKLKSAKVPQSKLQKVNASHPDQGLSSELKMKKSRKLKISAPVESKPESSQRKSKRGSQRKPILTQEPSLDKSKESSEESDELIPRKGYPQVPSVIVVYPGGVEL